MTISDTGLIFKIKIVKRDIRNSEDLSSTLKNSKTYTDIVILTPLKNEEEMARRKTEFLKDLKMLSMGRKATNITSKIVLSKKANIPKLFNVFFTEQALQMSTDASQP